MKTGFAPALQSLDPVVLGRVVALGDHLSVYIKVTARVVHNVGGAEAAADDVTLPGTPRLLERRGQRVAARPHVMHDDHGTRPVRRTKAAPTASATDSSSS